MAKWLGGATIAIVLVLTLFGGLTSTASAAATREAVCLNAVAPWGVAVFQSGAAYSSGVSLWDDMDSALVDSYDVSLEQIAKISVGYPDGRWKPWRSITRAQFVKMADIAFGIDPASPPIPTFSDVAAADYYYSYIEGAYLAGVVKGAGDGLFEPAFAMTREEAIAVVARRVAAHEDFDLGSMSEDEIAAALDDLEDASLVSPGLRAEMAFAAERHLIRGSANGNLAPHAPIFRIAAAALLVRAMEPRPIELDEDDDGSVITAKVGDVIRVVLEGNPTTGYSWRANLAERDAGILQQLGEPVYRADSDLIGAGGTYTFTFKVLAAGDAFLNLIYERSWETVPPLRTFVATVQVDSQPLEGTAWRLERWSVSSLYPGDFEITAAFDNDRISGKAAVNLYSGSYTASAEGDFSVEALISTLMAGPEPAMRAEGAFFQLLDQARSYDLSGSRLTLFGADGNEVLTFTSVS